VPAAPKPKRTISRGYRRGPDGRILCRWCEGPVAPPRRTFCSAECVDEFRIRSDPQFVREKLFERDHGVCRLCGVNTELLRVELNLKVKALGYTWRTRHDRRFMPGLRELAKQYGISAQRIRSGKGLWDADHVVPVVEGGGECGLENYRTLCIPCHKQVTADLRKRLAKKP
jgi:5-methylcytosine-specific restriction protein A